MFLGGRREAAFTQIVSEENLVHVLTEEKCLQYLIKISEEKRLVSNLLFEEARTSGQEHITMHLCECYSSLCHMDNILRNAEDSFNPEKSEFYVMNDDALRFVIYLSSVVSAKEKLPLYNLSFSLH